MLDASLFITGEIVERTIELADGTKHVLHFKQLPNTAFEKYAMWCSSADEDVVAKASARLLALGLCDSGGAAVIDATRAEMIKRPVMQRMVRALLEVNGYGANAEKPGNA